MHNLDLVKLHNFDVLVTAIGHKPFKAILYVLPYGKIYILSNVMSGSSNGIAAAHDNLEHLDLHSSWALDDDILDISLFSNEAIFSLYKSGELLLVLSNKKHYFYIKKDVDDYISTCGIKLEHPLIQSVISVKPISKEKIISYKFNESFQIYNVSKDSLQRFSSSSVNNGKCSDSYGTILTLKDLKGDFYIPTYVYVPENNYYICNGMWFNNKFIKRGTKIYMKQLSYYMGQIALKEKDITEIVRKDVFDINIFKKSIKENQNSLFYSKQKSSWFLKNCCDAVKLSGDFDIFIPKIFLTENGYDDLFLKEWIKQINILFNSDAITIINEHAEPEIKQQIFSMCEDGYLINIKHKCSYLVLIMIRYFWFGPYMEIPAMTMTYVKNGFSFYDALVIANTTITHHVNYSFIKDDISYEEVKDSCFEKLLSSWTLATTDGLNGKRFDRLILNK